MRDDEDAAFYFSVGMVIFLIFMIAFFGALGPVFSDWLLS